MKKLLLITLLTLPLATLADDDIFSKWTLKLLATGKAEGTCATMYRQATFQEETLIENGDDFQFRYWSSNAARLGMTIEEFFTFCEGVHANYLSYKNEGVFK